MGNFTFRYRVIIKLFKDDSSGFKDRTFPMNFEGAGDVYDEETLRNIIIKQRLTLKNSSDSIPYYWFTLKNPKKNRPLYRFTIKSFQMLEALYNPSVIWESQPTPDSAQGQERNHPPEQAAQQQKDNWKTRLSKMQTQLDHVREQERGDLQDALKQKAEAEGNRNEAQETLKRNKEEYQKLKDRERSEEDSLYTEICKDAVSSLVCFAGYAYYHNWLTISDTLLNQHNRIRALVTRNSGLLESLQQSGPFGQVTSPRSNRGDFTAAPSASKSEDLDEVWTDFDKRSAELEALLDRSKKSKRVEENNFNTQLRAFSEWSKGKRQSLNEERDRLNSETKELRQQVNDYEEAIRNAKVWVEARQIFEAYRVILRDISGLLREIADTETGQPQSWYDAIGQKAHRLLKNQSLPGGWRFFLVYPSPDDPYYADKNPWSESVRADFYARNARWPGLYFTKPGSEIPQMFAPGAHERANPVR